MSIALYEDKTKGSCEEDMDSYLRQIRAIPRLTPEQERSLAKRCAEGDEEAIKTMVAANLRLVVSVAREYAGRGVPLLDLVQEGSIGLLVAARKFDYTLEYRFSTYATKWIRQGVARCVMSSGELIRIPEYTAEKINKLKAARLALLKENGEEPTVAQIAQYTGMEEKKAEQLLLLLPQISSLDAVVGTDEHTTLQNLLQDLSAPQPQEELVRQELKQTINGLLSMLDGRQQQVLRLRFGMDDGVCRSYEQIGAALGVSKERARQLQNQAVEKLQKLGAGLGLEDFLE